LHSPVFLLLLLPALAALPLARRGGRVRAALAAAALLALVLALARPVVRIPRRAGTVVVVADRSASLPPAERDAQKALLDAVAARRAEGEKLGVVAFGETAAAEQIPQTAPFTGFRANPGEEGSDLDAALDLALSLIPPRDEARILVLSDGRATGPDPLAGAARRAAARGVPIDVRAQTPPRLGDTAIVRVDAPLRLRPGEPLLATAWVSSPSPQTIAYAFHRDRELVARGTHAVPAGLSPLSFRDLPRPEGVSAYSVAVAPATATEFTRSHGHTVESSEAADPVPENNAARFLVSREGSKPLLVVPASERSSLPALLRGAGVELETRAPAELDLEPAALAAWSGVLIENRRAGDFGPVGLANLAAWVRDAGGGLALTGGRNSFGPGGWHKSPVEDILPVSLELRREHRKFPMAIAVALDRSGSMGMPVGGGSTKMDLADLATAEVLDMLADDDRIGVWAVDTEAHLVVPMKPAAAARADRKKILSIESMGGGICIEEALVAALGALRATDAPIRHLVVFGDAADSAQHPGAYREMARAALEAGITVSAIGLGSDTDSDAQILRNLAEDGGGICEFTEDAGELPRLFAQDTMLAAREVMVTNPTVPRFTAALPQLSSRLPLSGAPAVGGYCLTYLRPEGTAAAVTTDDNDAPLVAFRPVGSGRTAIFAGEADGEFAGPFARWEHAPELHASLARFAAGSAEASLAGPAFPLSIPRLTPTSLDIDLYPPAAPAADDAAEHPASGIHRSSFDLAVLRTSAAGRTRSERVPLAWTAPDRLSASIPLHGGETVLPVLSDPATGATRTLPPARLPYSPEYAPDPDGAGEALLASLADLTGGQRLADPAAVWSLLPREPVPFELAPFLYLLAALLLLLDIFDRRTAFLTRRFAAREKEQETKDKEQAEKAEKAEEPKENAARREPRPTAQAPNRPTIEPPNQDRPPPVAAEDPFARAKRRSASRTRGA
jgi:hypothetical protein